MSAFARRFTVAVLLVSTLTLWGAADAAAQHATSEPAAAPTSTVSDHPAPSTPASTVPAAEHAVPVEGHAAAASHDAPAHGESIWATLGRLFNFAVLVGAGVYFLRAPLTQYLTQRSEQIRADLVTAAATREAATKELAAIEARMHGLPDEIAALKQRGKSEIEAEQQRITAAAEAERQRLLDQARTQIEQQTRAARRELQEYAATLAVDVARARLSSQLSEADHDRLVTRYVDQVKTAHD